MFKRYVIGAGVAVALGAAIYAYGQWQYSNGFKASEHAAQIEIGLLNMQARAKEQALIAQQAERDKQQYKEYKDAQNTITQLRADVAAGKRRLSVKTKATVCAGSGTATANLDNGTTRAELDPTTAQDLIGLMAKGDQAIRQLNALQDWAEVVIDN